MYTSYPVTFGCALQDTVSFLSPGFTAVIEGISKDGSGILFSISLTNSTCAISTSGCVFFVPVIRIDTFFTAICPPKSSTSTPPASVLTEAPALTEDIAASFFLFGSKEIVCVRSSFPSSYTSTTSPFVIWHSVFPLFPGSAGAWIAMPPSTGAARLPRASVNSASTG